MKRAALEQEGQGWGWLIVLGILVWAFVLRRKEGDGGGDQQPPPDGGATGPLEIRGLTVSTASSPLTVKSISFEYRGPASDLRFGIAGKPNGAIMGVDFNNGRNVVDPYWFSIPFSVPATQDWTRREQAINYSMQDPVAGLYTARGGSTREFIEGMADVWVWVFNATAFRQGEGRGAAYFEDYANEKYIVVIDTDADVLPVQPAGLAVRNLTVSYL